MQLFCRLVPPSSLTAHPNVMFSKTWPGSRHANLVSILGLTQGDPRPPPPPLLLENPSYAPFPELEYDS